MTLQGHPPEPDAPVTTSFVDVLTGQVSSCSVVPPSCGASRAERLAELGLMSAGIVHDLGNYLQGIAAGVVGLKRRLGDGAEPETRLLVDEILRASDRAALLIRRALDHVAVGGSDRAMLDLAAVVEDLSPLIGWIVGPYVEVGVAIAEAPNILACPRDLERAIVNLVVNARQAMPRGGRLVLDISRLPPCAPGGSDRAMLRVSDTGCGMSPETIRRAFDPYFSARPERPGSGLGLSVIANFMRDLGGLAQIESAPGEGTSIFLIFPGLEI